MKSVLKASAAIVLCVGVAAPAFAQAQGGNQNPPQTQPQPIPSPSRVDRYPNGNYFEREFDRRKIDFSSPDIAIAYRDSKSVAGCLASIEEGPLSPYVGGPLSEDPKYKLLSKRLRKSADKCIKPNPAALQMLVGASIAELQVLGHEGTYEPRAMSLNSDEAEAFYTPKNGSATVDHIGRCVAVYSPGLSVDVLKAEVGSPAEEQALDKLYKSTPECGLSARPASVPNVLQRAAIAFGLHDWNAAHGG